MKKIIASLLFVSAFTFVNAQENKEKKEKKEPKMSEAEVPAAVKATFASQFPGVKAEKWEKEKGNFEVGFHKNKTEMSCLIDASGKLLETETEIPVSELPKAVSDYVAKNKPGKKIKEASKIVDASGTMTWEAEVEKMDLVFDKDGKFIKEAKD
jgi:hypothetical protein